MKKCICCLTLLMGCVVSTKEAIPEADFDAVTVATHDGLGPFRGSFEVCDEGTPGALDEHTPYHFLAFDSDGCDDTFIDVASRDGDDLYMLMYRRVRGAWRVMHRNDDCRGSLNSCYEGGLAAGSYLVAVTTYEYMRYRTPTAATYEVNVHCDGDAACGTLGIGCGGFRAIDDVVVCDDGQFCDIPTGCGWADQSGLCTQRPEICPTVVDPVCGCDDHTYPNACEAASAGVSVLREGTCGTLDQACGSRGLTPCEDGQFCNFPVTAACGATDRPGVCEVTPTSCSFRRVWVPVCGCDGRNYDDACFAFQHGISVASEGACETEAVSCADSADCIASERCIGRPEGFPYGKCRNVTTHPGYQASCFADSECNAHLVCIAHDNTGRGYCAEDWMREEFESNDERAIIPPITMARPLVFRTVVFGQATVPEDVTIDIDMDHTDPSSLWIGLKPPTGQSAVTLWDGATMAGPLPRHFVDHAIYRDDSANGEYQLLVQNRFGRGEGEVRGFRMVISSRWD